MGRHAARGYGRFSRELFWYVLKFAAAAVVFFGMVWFLINIVPGWFGGDETASTAVTIAETTTTTQAIVVSVPSTTATPSTTTTTTVTTSTSTTTTTTIPAEREPTAIVVIVLNSTGRAGLAAGLNEDLAALGYQTLEPDNSTPVLAVSEVLFAPGFAAEAYTLAAQIPDAEILANPSTEPQADIVVILGASFGQ